MQVNKQVAPMKIIANFKIVVWDFKKRTISSSSSSLAHQQQQENNGHLEPSRTWLLRTFKDGNFFAIFLKLILQKSSSVDVWLGFKYTS